MTPRWRDVLEAWLVPVLLLALVAFVLMFGHGGA